ncbi:MULTISPECIES: hydrogenase expression/formation protein [Methylosinus]|uniref:Hydrogenase expression/formation protein n=1 Tax=Methylosinus trichosporium (strain ATCC 35070 / NCIMB 11131 / UNIQEM 75 / OB3b) TaxID=595536 RepID=A0A2D2CWA4_METT3|nr:MULTISPECIES: hydrogenase expression/formation protein [Methylosinus]ATQ67061.1 hydrogenase expression/formation protein [Methylosinus trichosporium OB3b]OBS50861.1 hydrogenase accessory protein HypB [Methylosinus sp. 3S-1]
MKAGFWIAPEGSDDTMTMLPLAEAGEGVVRGKDVVAFLATASAEESIARCPRTAELLPRLAQALDAQRADAAGQLFDITDYEAHERELIGQVLGEGEVSGLAALPDGGVAQLTEAAMAGLWRVRFTDAAGRLVADYLEIASIPHVVERASAFTAERLSLGEAPEGAMNVMPILAEIDGRMRAHRPGGPSHTINFSLLPVNEIDMDFLQRTLGEGPVQLVSRGYGHCKVTATGARNVWSVQFFNAMSTIILDTLEIGDTPEAARAADEDFRDSAERLREIHEAYFA